MLLIIFVNLVTTAARGAKILCLAHHVTLQVLESEMPIMVIVSAVMVIMMMDLTNFVLDVVLIA